MADKNSKPAPNNNNKKSFVLRIGQFNCLNLVKEDTYFYGKNIYDKKTVDKKVEWIASQLKKMRAGIVGFEEVFHAEVLKRCIDSAGIYEKAQLVCVDANGSGPAVALVSIYPIVEKSSIKDFPKESLLQFDNNCDLPIKKFSRPVLRAVIQLPTGVKITVFVAHAKSKRPIVDDSQRHDQKAKAVGHALSLTTRAAEAAALRCVIVDEIRNNPGRPVVLVGDLNDTVHSVTTEIITGTKPYVFLFLRCPNYLHSKHTHVLYRWKKLPKPEKEKIWDVLLHSTNEVQVRLSDRDVTFTHIHNGRYDVLDHILVSKEFCRGYEKYLGYVQYVSIFNDHLVDETLVDEKRDNIASDHGQVVVQLKLCSKPSNNGKQGKDDDDE